MVKAVDTNKTFDGGLAFKVGMGQLDKFMCCYGFQQLDVSDKKLSADSTVVTEYYKNLIKEIDE